MAAAKGHEAVVKLLLDVGNVDIESRNISGQTPLSLAATNGHAAVVQLLLEKDNVDVNSTTFQGQTPLSRAADNGHEAVVKLLLETGKVDVKSQEYQMALRWAQMKGHKGIVTLLVTYYAEQRWDS